MSKNDELKKEIEKKELEIKLQKLNNELAETKSAVPAATPGFVSEQTATTRIGEILMSIVAVIWCLFIIPMAWAIPFLIGQGKRKRGEMPITTGHVVIGFFFYGWLGALLVAIGGNVEK